MNTMAGTGGNQAGRNDGTAPQAGVAHSRVVRHAAGVLAGFCCLVSLGVGLAACGQSASGIAPRNPVYLAARLPLASRLVYPAAADTATAAASATAGASATAAATTPTATPAATATDTPAATATTVATATAAATATGSSSTTTTISGSGGSGTASAGDNGNFYAGIVLIATGALLLLLLLVGLAAYLLVWRKRDGAVLMERSGDRDPGSYGGYGSGGYGDDDGYNSGMSAGPDEPTTPFGDHGTRGGPGGWPDTSGGRGYGDPSQWRGGSPGGSRGGSQGGPRPPRPAR